MARNIIIQYKPKLRQYARQLRNHSTLEEVILWKQIKGRSLGVEFHRQVPIASYIVDFYCHELFLAIEVDGSSHDNKKDYDVDRQSSLEAKGVSFIRFTNEDIRCNMNGVINALQQKIEKLKDK